jgi:uncharacterized protein YjiS (DUF1127 family)
MRPGDSLARPLIIPTITRKEKIMFLETSTHNESRSRVFSLLAVALTPWHMLGKLMTEHRARAELSRLDDYLLKDIGLSRGSIDSAIRDRRNGR